MTSSEVVSKPVVSRSIRTPILMSWLSETGSNICRGFRRRRTRNRRILRAPRSFRLASHPPPAPHSRFSFESNNGNRARGRQRQLIRLREIPYQSKLEARPHSQPPTARTSHWPCTAVWSTLFSECNPASPSVPKKGE